MIDVDGTLVGIAADLAYCVDELMGAMGWQKKWGLVSLKKLKSVFEIGWAGRIRTCE